MDPLTQDIVKEKLNDGNGGNAFLFWQIFLRLDSIKEDQKAYEKNMNSNIAQIQAILEPLQEEYKAKQTTKKFIKKCRVSTSAWLALVMALINLYFLLQQFKVIP